MVRVERTLKRKQRFAIILLALWPLAMMMGLRGGSLLLTPAGRPNSPQESVSEFQLKAVMLQTFTLFIEWPEYSGVNDSSKPFVIGVLGKSPILDEVYSIYVRRGQAIKEKKVEVRRISTNDEIFQCNLLFICRSAQYRLSKIIASIESSPILTVSDTDGFGERGVHINFVVKRRNVRFEVNRKAVKKSGLIASHHLLKAALRVISSP